MRPIDKDLLAPIVDGLLARTPLTPLEHAEILRIAQAYTAEESADALHVSGDVIRARRKRIYRKLGVSSVSELAALLLAYSLRAQNLAAPTGT
jgi:DNA-binding CsgD family transcriptional regulator